MAKIHYIDGDFETLGFVLNNNVKSLNTPNIVIVGNYDGTVINIQRIMEVLEVQEMKKT